VNFIVSADSKTM